ncbi:hypothetical protein IFR05_005394 [Cadophora sp. M221]|nr:hypothetical protein IFR05_005394 [Cadophora sp. M221]
MIAQEDNTAGAELEQAITALTPYEIEELLKIDRAAATPIGEENFKAVSEQLRSDDGEKVSAQ